MSGSAGILYHGLNLGSSTGSDQVMGDLQDVFVKAIGIEAFQGLRDLPVNPLAPRRAGGMVEHVPDQGVDELQCLPLALQEEALLHALLQQVEQLVLAHM